MRAIAESLALCDRIKCWTTDLLAIIFNERWGKSNSDKQEEKKLRPLCCDFGAMEKLMTSNWRLVITYLWVLIGRIDHFFAALLRFRSLIEERERRKKWSATVYGIALALFYAAALAECVCTVGHRIAQIHVIRFFAASKKETARFCGSSIGSRWPGKKGICFVRHRNRNK